MTYNEFINQVKAYQADSALAGPGVDLLSQNPEWTAMLVSELLEAAE